MADELWMVAGLVAVILVMGAIYALQIRYTDHERVRPAEPPPGREPGAGHGGNAGANSARVVDDLARQPDQRHGLVGARDERGCQEGEEKP